MKYGELMAGLRGGRTSHLYLLAGEEGYYIDKAKEALIKIWQCPVEDVQVADGASLSEIMTMAESVPFLTDKNVILVKSASLFKDKGEGSKKLEEKFFAMLQNLPEFSYVIFEYHGKPDKRKKLYKVLDNAGVVMESEPIRAGNIGDWLQGKLQELNKSMDRQAYEYLVGAVSSMQTVDLAFLNREMEKLALFLGTEERRITKQHLLTAFSDVPEISSFAMLNAIGAGHTAKALQLFQKLQDNGVYFAMTIGLLARQIRLWWQAQSLLAQGIRGRALAGRLGQPPFIAEKTAREAAAFPRGLLPKALLALSDADFWLKTGQGDLVELEAVIIMLANRGRDAL